MPRNRKETTPVEQLVAERDAVQKQYDAVTKKLAPYKAKLEALRNEMYDLEYDQSDLSAQVRNLNERIRVAKLPQPPFGPGDIVKDERNVEYRVTDSWLDYYDHSKYELHGIRLAKDGHEAHQKPRPIVSRNLTKTN